jgi:hypothetical protein
MKNTSKIAGFIAATAALSMLVATSASAEERHRDGTWRDNGGYHDSARSNDANRNNGSFRNESRNNTYRDESRSNAYRNESRSNGYRNETRGDSYRHEGRDHISDHGRISRFERERDGYRVWLGGPRSYWIPSYRLGGHRLAIGLDIRLGGIFNGTYVDVDALGWPGDPYYNDPYYAPAPYYADGYLSGRVERVDYRYGTLLLRDDRSGRAIEVDMRATDRRGGLDLDDLRPGDRVTLDGTWDRGYFHAYRIDGVRQY